MKDRRLKKSPVGVELVRTLAEPARGLAAVIKAYSETGAEPSAA